MTAGWPSIVTSHRVARDAAHNRQPGMGCRPSGLGNLRAVVHSVIPIAGSMFRTARLSFTELLPQAVLGRIALAFPFRISLLAMKVCHLGSGVRLARIGVIWRSAAKPLPYAEICDRRVA